ncbi:hypothetical protein L3Y34_002355 [Caenorhabditis briggsae]|uniref:Uncharacterized protein n=2 Tax=Caenorhabditis briggsae TaxID=6238 RepID=A0AAE9DEH9_CAEBR|nr:hypothetical protein L3Y34_002355 [Caenorhabditis briggsae]
MRAEETLDYFLKREKGILIIAILDLISDLDRRAFYLEYKGKVPFPRGLRRVSKKTLKRSSLQQLVMIWEHYDRIQDYLMALFMEVNPHLRPWYLDTCVLEWEIQEFGRKTKKTIGRIFGCIF